MYMYHNEQFRECKEYTQVALLSVLITTVIITF
jgi:hypothetical protein